DPAEALAPAVKVKGERRPPSHGPGSIGGGLRELFISVAVQCPAVVCCRCSPEQKALVCHLVKQYTGLQTLSVGDGGNDVAMIQMADVGVGLEGKEGKQASLASDFSIRRFRDLRHLLFWHGRNSYVRSANMAQFVISRGVTISILQAIFSALFFFSSVSLFSGLLLIGYSTVYTALPVLALVLDEDVTRQQALAFPQLYRNLAKGRQMTLKTFFTWCAISTWEGGCIILMTMSVMDSNFFNIVGVAFSVLIVVELLTLGFYVHSWRPMMVVAEVASLLLYFGSILCMRSYFDMTYILSASFYLNVLYIALVAALPVCVTKLVFQCVRPNQAQKLKSSD
ncbi:P-type ATPase, subfamily IV, partial [Kipferlia bialata]